MGKSCWMASLALQQLFPIQILLIFLRFSTATKFYILMLQISNLESQLSMEFCGIRLSIVKFLSYVLLDRKKKPTPEEEYNTRQREEERALKREERRKRRDQLRSKYNLWAETTNRKKWGNEQNMRVECDPMDSRFRSSTTQKSRVYSQLRIFSELDQELNVVRHNLRAEYDTTIIRTKFNFCVEYDADSGLMTKHFSCKDSTLW